MMEKQKRLVASLVRRTKDSSIEWQSTIREGRFQVNFTTSSVQIYSTPTDMDEDDIHIALLNDQGDVVESFTDVSLTRDSDEEGKSWYPIMLELYSLARRSVLGADRLLDSMLNELDDDIVF